MAMNGKFMKKGHIATYPLRIPMTTQARLDTIRAGAKVVREVARYTNVVRKRAGESDAMRQQRVYDFQNTQSSQDFVGDLSEDAAALFKTTVTESIASALGDNVQLNSTVNEVVNRPHSVVVRYSQDGTDYEVEARTAILATTANISRDIGVDLPEDLRDALGQIKYGPHVS